MKYYIRILSYDNVFPAPLYGEKMVWCDDWQAYILEIELTERPNIWKLVDSVRDGGFQFEQLDLIEGHWQGYDFSICCTIERLTD